MLFSSEVFVLNVTRKFVFILIFNLLFLGIASASAETIYPILPIPNSEFKEIYPPAIETMHVRIDPIHVKHEIHIHSKPPISVPVKLPPIAKNLKNFTHGIASYYCLIGVSRCTRHHPGGMYAAIRRDLLFLRGRTVQVCADKNNCIYVKIIDCNCGPHANLIDLYSDAFKRLTNLSRGVVKVMVKW